MEAGVRAKGVGEKEHVEEAHRLTPGRAAGLQAPLTAGICLRDERRMASSPSASISYALCPGETGEEAFGGFCAEGEVLAPEGRCSCHQDG